MSYSTNYNLNQRIKYLEWEVGKIAPTPVGGYDLENVLIIGNNAGSTDIDLNNQDILNGNSVETNNLTSSNYNLTTDKPIYQELDPSWNAVNGFLASSTQSYPAQNPIAFDSTFDLRTAAVGNLWSAVAWSPELSLFVSCSFTGVGNRIQTSVDGINWTSRVSAADHDWRSVCWGNNLFVCVADTGITGRVQTSSDGINWSAQISPVTQAWYSVIWVEELSLFVAVGNGFTNAKNVMTSLDSVTWIEQTGAINSDFRSVCWSPQLGLLIAVSRGGYIMSSPDAVNWTLQTSPELNQWLSVCWSRDLGIFVAVSENGSNRIMTSNDGISWYSQVASASNEWTSVIWVSQLKLFFSVAKSGTNRLQISQDGINWESVSVASQSWRGICYSPELGLVVAVSSDGTSRVMTSLLTQRTPTSFNVFDSSFNNIDNNGLWSFTAKEINSSSGTIQIDSAVIDLQNTNTTSSVSNHNTALRSTSSGLTTNTYLKLSLNGSDIWVPYFTTNPSI